MRLNKYTSDIWALDHFLTQKECYTLIKYAEQLGYQQSIAKAQAETKDVNGIRYSDRLIHYNTNFAKKWWKNLRPYCPLHLDSSFAIGINERFRFYKYKIGHRFDRHFDTKYRRSVCEESKVSFVMYLNEDFEGGKTKFDEVTITPKTGTLVCFKQKLYHEGTSVLGGTKYIIRSEIMYRSVEHSSPSP